MSRNSPSTIKARARSVWTVCAACSAITISILSLAGSASSYDIVRFLGLYPVDLVDIAKCLVLILILFAGPLFEEGIVEGNWRYWLRWDIFRGTVFDDWIGWRNLVVGPVSEELVFRSLSVSLFLLAQVSSLSCYIMRSRLKTAIQAEPRDIIFSTPLIFGLAHLHHLNEHIVTHQRHDQTYLAAVLTPSIILPGIVRALFQLIYTSLFGFFTTFLFLRTGNLYSCILAHSFCNWMGLPRVWGRVGNVISEEAERVVENRDSDKNVSTLQDRLASGRSGWSHGTSWTVAYYVLLFTGAFGFYKLLWPLTESANRLAVL